MLKYKIERFFRTENNSRDFKKVVYMIENNLGQSFPKSPNIYINRLIEINILLRDKEPGHFKFSELGEKYYQYFTSNRPY